MPKNIAVLPCSGLEVRTVKA